MQFVMIFSLVIAVLAVLFAMQNTASVTLQFFVWTFHSPLAVLLLVALTIGAVLTSLLTIPGWFKSKKSKSSHQKEIAELEDSLSKYRTDLIDTQNKNKDLRQKILELEEAKQNLEKVYENTNREINDLHDALNNAKLTVEEAEQAKKEAIAARNEMDTALLEMEAKLSSPLFSDQNLTTENQPDYLPSKLPDSKPAEIELNWPEESVEDTAKEIPEESETPYPDDTPDEDSGPDEKTGEDA